MSIASDSSDIGDLEEQITCYFIRKKVHTIQEAKGSTVKHLPKRGLLENIPILLGDLQNVTFDTENSQVLKIKLGSKELRFRYCISHVVVVGVGRNNNSFHKYIIDDGTGTMEMSIYRHTEELSNIAHMQNENKWNSNEYTKEVTDSLHRLLSKAAEQLDASNIPIGCRLLVQGRPQSFRGKLQYSVYGFTKDQGISRKMEVAFKNYLLQWYSKQRGVSSS